MNNVLYIPATANQKQQAVKVEKVGGLNKGNRAVKIQQKRDNLETIFLASASRENKKAERAQAQREARRAKR